MGPDIALLGVGTGHSRRKCPDVAPNLDGLGRRVGAFAGQGARRMSQSGKRPTASVNSTDSVSATPRNSGTRTGSR
jgi:hypothetical protein